MATPTLTENQVTLRAAVTEHYLETGKAADTSQLSERLTWSAAKVRRVLADGLDGVWSEDERRASYSRNYRSEQSGTHRVVVYGPTLDHLRSLLLEARKQASHSEGTAYAPDGTNRLVTIPSR